MATNSSNSDQAAQSAHTRQDSDTNLSGLTAAFGRLAEVGPQVASLQQTLVDGIVRAQRRELERLSKRYGEDDPRVAIANMRAQGLADLRGEVMEHASQIANFVSGMRSEGLFHGYVFLADGSAAQGYVVRASVNDPAQRGVRKGEAKTDANGYFRINMSGAYQKTEQRSAGLDHIIEMARHTDTAAAPEPAPASKSEKAAAAKPVVAKAEVLDSKGRVVFEDPIPPTFETLNSEFRLYALDATSKAASAS